MGLEGLDLAEVVALGGVSWYRRRYWYYLYLHRPVIAFPRRFAGLGGHCFADKSERLD
jgi:predicted GNAT superfamily acetyltransferase